jgi:Helicase associated domain
MSKELRVRDKRETVRGASPTTENEVKCQNGSDAVMNPANLCYAYRNNFVETQLLMLKALSQRMTTTSSQVQMNPIFTQTNLPRFDSYLPNFFEYNCTQSFPPMHPGSDFLRRNQFNEEASDAEYHKFMLYLAERQFIQNASTRVWAQSVQRDILCDYADQINATSGSILHASSHSDLPTAWDRKPSTSTSPDRNQAVAKVQDDQTPTPSEWKKVRIDSKRLSSSSEYVYTEDSFKPAAVLKQVEKPPAMKASKEPKLDFRWLTSLSELKQFKQANGHTIVPRGYSENPKLASWVSKLIIDCCIFGLTIGVYY